MKLGRAKEPKALDSDILKPKTLAPLLVAASDAEANPTAVPKKLACKQCAAQEGGLHPRV